MPRKSIKVKNLTGSVFVGENVGGNVINNVTNSFNLAKTTTLDLSQLADELAKLREAMKKQAKDADADIAVSEIAKAEQAARKKKISIVMKHLKSVGDWALKTATQIGVPVATEAIKQASGIK